MKKSLILLAILTMSATNVLAGNTPESAAVQLGAEIQAKRMSDADLDKVTAGVVIQNPGKAFVNFTHKSGKVTCINCGTPPPPPGGTPPPPAP